jgi:hypothetical protein
MNLATEGEWKGSYLNHHIDGKNVWQAITSNSESPHREIVHYVNEYQNVAFQKDMKKYIYSYWGDQSVLAPNHVFEEDLAPENAMQFGSCTLGAV